MFRRCLALALIPLLLLPGLCFAHTHAGSAIQEPPGHDSQPHFHLRFLFHCLLCSTCPVISRCQSDPGLRSEEPGPDHDADAVYVTVSASVGRLNEHVSAAPEQVRPLSLPVYLNQVATPVESTNRLLALVTVLPAADCPLYLHQRALLL